MNYETEEILYRELVAEEWRSGSLAFLMKPHQLELYQMLREFLARPQRKNLKFVANCARRFGKTFSMLSLAMELAKSKPNSVVRFAAPSRLQLKEILIPSFRTIISELPVGSRPVFKSQDNCIIFREGLPDESRIVMAGCDDSESIERLRGTAADLCVVTEAGSISRLEYLIKDILMPQLLTTGGKLLVDSTPPPDIGHYFNVMCDEAILQGNYAEFDITKNTSIDEETREAFIEELGGLQSPTVRRELFCMRIADEELSIVPEWHNRATRVNRPKFFSQVQKLVSLDIGGKRDKTVLLFGYFHDGTLVIEREISLNPEHTTTRNIAIKYRDAMRELEYKEARQVGDTNNAILFRDLQREYNINFLPTSKDSLIAMVAKVRDMCDTRIGPSRILVHPDCKELLICLSSGVWNKNKDEWGRHPVVGHYDALAALMYMVRNVRGNTIKKERRDGFFATNEEDASWLRKIANMV